MAQRPRFPLGLALGRVRDASRAGRLDRRRVADALAAGMPLTAGGIAIRIAEPDDLLTAPKQTVA